MTYKKVVRIKDKRIFFIRIEKDKSKFLCSETKRMIKHLRDVSNFENIDISLF